MSEFGFGALGEFAIADFGMEQFSQTDYEAFINSSRPSRYLLMFSAIKRTGGYLGEAVDFALAENAIGEIPGGSAVLDEADYFISDGPWIGRPDDDFQSNRLFDPRMVETGNVERSIPLSPESSRRSEISVGTLKFTNPDGGLDELISERSVANRTLSLWYGPRRGKFKEFGLVAEMIGQDFQNDLETVNLRVTSTVAYLDEPFHTTKYQGTGGREGDIQLAGTYVPTCYGDCFNITPVLERADIYMYRVHDGQVLAIDEVKDKGGKFIFDADYPTYNALVAHDFGGQTGHYATCLREGRFRASFAGQPAGKVTCDVRGDVDASGYTDRTGDILLRLALNRAKIQTTFIDFVSFNALPTGAIGYYNAQDNITIADVFDDLLRAINGWYGTRRSKALRAGRVKPPEQRPTKASFVTEDAINIEEIEVEQPPRYQQTVLYRKNWTPMNEDEVLITLDTDERGALLAEGVPITITNPEVKVRDRNAIVGQTITTYFRDEIDAKDSLDLIMDLYRESRRRFLLTLPRIGYLYDLEDYVNVSNKRYGLQNGKNFTVISTRDSSRENQVVLTIWG